MKEQLNAREEILHKTHEQWNVFVDKFGQVRVFQGLHKQLIFSILRVGASNTTSHGQNGFQSSQTEIIVILLGQLLLSQSVHCGQFLCQFLKKMRRLETC